MGYRAIIVSAVLAAGLLPAGSASAAADPGPPPGTPTATGARPDPSVGPLFRQGIQHDHSCTATVLHTPTRDLLITAAHCISGTSAGTSFVPGYDRGASPYGVWTVTQAYVDPRWESQQDTRFDYAILRVAPQRVHGRTLRVQDVSGGVLLGLAPRTGDRITDYAYNAGLNDRPVRCTVPTYVTDGYPSFNCRGYVGGSSGSAWLTRLPGTDVRIVRGVIGGLHQGGCYDYTSYSSPFTPAVYAVLWRATFGVHPDTVPAAGGDGC